MEYDRAYFAGKAAAVTGGASGIGLALCEELLESGADRVVLADFNRENLAQHEARLSRQYPGRVKGVLCNVTVEDEVRDMIGRASEFGGGRLDLLVNCAGAALTGKFTEEPDGLDPGNPFLRKRTTNEDWKNGFAINFYGPLYGCRHAIPLMLRQGGGQIVNIISGIAFSPMAYQSIYAATKSALNALTLCLRAEYAHHNIRFNSATPGTTATAIFKEAGSAPPEAQTPHQSAQRILNGVANNDRLILGDDSDLEGAGTCFLPDIGAKRLDEVFLAFARQRRSGKLSFVAQNEDSPEDLAAMDAMTKLLEIEASDLDAVFKRLRGYLAQRDASRVDGAYYAGKTAAVTGGASGIGLALCEELLRCGAEKVVLADRNRANLDAQARRLNGLYPGRVKGVPCDVADEDDVRAMVASAAEFFGGRFDLLVNCAGVGQSGMFTQAPDSAEITARSRMEVEPPERWAFLFSVNFYGALYGCRAALPIMLRQGGGQVVNIISGTAFSPMPYQSIYASTKAALNALTLVLRYEYWDDGIKFNSATPGTTATPIFAEIGAPPGAQSPTQSALRILTGAAKNERLVLGDDEDALSAMLWGNPKLARFWDGFFEGVEASRRAGNVADYGQRDS